MTRLAGAQAWSASAMGNERLVGIALALVGTLLLSMKSVLVKMAYAAGSDAEALLALRMVIALPVYGVIWACQPAHGALTLRQFAAAAGIGVLGYGISSYLDLKGLEYLSASVERLVLFTYPLFVALLGAWLMSVPIGKRVLQGLALSYAGLAIVMADHLAVDARATVFGGVLVLGSALTFAAFQLYAGKMVREIGATRFTCVALSAAAVVSIAVTAVRRPTGDLVPSLEVAILGFVLAIFGTILPSFAMSAALKRISAQANSAIGAMSPAVTTVLAVWILGERMSTRAVFGAVLIVIGTVVATRQSAATNRAS
jgi:drug/metabolite transporter (DMT)-like permease